MVVPRRQESEPTPKTTAPQTISAVRTRVNLVIFSNFRSVNPLSKVLFIVPSRYFYTIGLPPIFSFGRKLPPILHSTQKERDSSNSIRLRKRLKKARGYHPLWHSVPKDLSSTFRWIHVLKLQPGNVSPQLSQ